MIHTGDVREVLAQYPDNHFDAVLCDPPCGLAFMGKRWDYDVPSTDLWAEVLRVCKPGASLVAFFGTRTYHRGVVRIEDAGFEIRDCLAWMYGSGFPKSLDVSKAIDKAAGVEPLGSRPASGVGFIRPDGDWNVCNNRLIMPPATTDAARAWSGYGTALKPAFEPAVLARKPLDGTVAQNVARWGVGALAIDACRIASEAPIAAHHGTGGGAGRTTGAWSDNYKPGDAGTVLNHAGRWPANVILDEEAGAVLDGQTGTLKSGALREYTRTTTPPVYEHGTAKAGRRAALGWDKPADSGGASRFFYCAKASRRERGEGNTHPTVKPLALCEYLARLLMPPNPGCILVPFAGSGSEMIGAIRAGWREVVGIEREAAYVDIARRRIDAA